MTQHRGGSGNFAEDRQKRLKQVKRRPAERRQLQNDREKASEAGKKAVRTAVAANL